MKILVSNDDGYLAPGLAALARAMKALGDVTVVAPDSNRSGCSNSLTLDRPLSVQRADNGFYFINGTPSDCVHIALTAILEERPDLVVSGVNQGQNMGDDTLYSGTVAAAMEGYLFGIPSFAFSQVSRGWGELECAAQIASDVVQRYLGELADPFLLNVNIPNLPPDQLKGIKPCRLGRRHASEPVVQGTDPHGRTIYWIGPAGKAKDAGEGTDFHAVANGFVSVTPLHAELTHFSQLDHLNRSAAHD